ncbi:hypothetical protein [Spiroplasma endosymbiont of Diplazon laetatorius]|uniref:hypothetical protein n=1 Tax=Spiroplasma endosymbiont of Diplazon laetatorius TaxID=3066322 RepID=UPI0030D2BF47
MIRFSKTISQVGCYLLLTTLMPIMIISILMINLKGLVNKGYEMIARWGEWLKDVTDSSLTSISAIGWAVLIICLISYGLLIFDLVLINSRKAYKQKIGYILGLSIGVILFVIFLLPIIITNAKNDGDALSNLLLGLLIVFVGLNGTLLSVGSLFGLFFAKTNVDNYEK